MIYERTFFPNKNMNNSHQSPQISLHIPPATWNSFRQAMLNARQSNEEVIGFLFCQRHQISKRQVRYFPQVWVVPAPDCYEHQSASGLVLKEEFHLYLLENYLSQGKLDVVHVHTHAGQETPSFSGVDNRCESEYARFLNSRFPQKHRLISGVFDQEFLDGTSPRIYPWNQSKISNRKSSSPRNYPWGQSKI